MRKALMGPCLTMAGALLLLSWSPSHAKQCLEGTARAKERAFSPAVATEGGKVVWLAGQTALEDATGKSLEGNFEGQTRAVFAALDRTLQRAGGKLDDVVTMTVFITDVRHGDRFVQIRKELFKDCYPASALVTVSGFARPGILIEIQGVAVLGGK